MTKQIYAFTWKVSATDTHERVAEFSAVDEDSATKAYSKWIKENKFIYGEALGPIVSVPVEN